MSDDINEALREHSSLLGSLAGKMDGLITLQNERDRKAEEKFDKIMAQLVVTDAKAESAHRRLSKYKWIGTGLMSAATMAWGAAKLLWAHADVVAKDIDKLKGH